MSIKAYPSKVEFGKVFENLYKPGIPESHPERSVTLTNTDEREVEILSVEVSGAQFQCSKQQLTIPGYESVEVVIKYAPAPSDYGLHLGNLRFLSEIQAPVDVELQGEFIFFP